MAESPQATPEMAGAAAPTATQSGNQGLDSGAQASFRHAAALGEEIEHLAAMVAARPLDDIFNGDVLKA